MQLEAVRTVLSNEVNEISVCEDLKRDTGVFYTMISITSPAVRRQVAGLLAADNLFANNNDFIGSFSQGDSLNLVFLYRQENLLSRREAIYGTSFARRKQMVESLLVSLVESQAEGSVGRLMLADRNINITGEGSIYFNYFLDFADWDPEEESSKFFYETSQLCFDILSREYYVKHDGRVASYPGELQVFAKKVQLGAFTSFNSILTFVKLMPDEPSEPAVGWRKLLEKLRGLIDALRRNSMTLFMVVIVAATLIFAIYQISMRWSYRSAAEKNTTYIGLETIGEVYLGDENI